MKHNNNNSLNEKDKKELLDDKSPSNKKGDFAVSKKDDNSYIDPFFAIGKEGPGDDEDEDEDGGKKPKTVKLSQSDLDNTDGESTNPMEDLNSNGDTEYPDFFNTGDLVEPTLVGSGGDGKQSSEGISKEDIGLSKEATKLKYGINLDDSLKAYDESVYSDMTSIFKGEGLEDYRDYLKVDIKGNKNNYNRALNQSNWDQFGNSVVRTAFNVLPEIAAQAAYGVEGIVNLVTGRDSYGNSVSEFMEEVKQGVNEDFNIYLEDPEAHLSVGDFAWWADRGSSLATSISAFMALGYATGGIAGFSRLTKAASAVTSKSNRFAKEFKSIVDFSEKYAGKGIKAATGSKKSIDFASMGDALVSSYLLNNAEAVGSATAIYNETKDQVYKELIQKGYSEEQALKEANTEALRVGDRNLAFNRINILLNLTSLAPFVRKEIRGTRAGFLKEKTFGKSVKRLGFESTQESIEEIINGLSNFYAKDDDYFSDEEGVFSTKKLFMDLSKGEIQESAFLGALGGLGQTGLTLTGQYIPTRYDKKDGKMKSSHTIYKENVAAQEESKNFLQEIQDGTNTLDIFKSTKDQLTLLKELDKARKEEDSEKETAILEGLFINRAYDNFVAGTAGEFEAALNSMKEGIKNDESLSNEERESNLASIEKKQRQFEELEAVYNKVSNKYGSSDLYNTKAQQVWNEDILEGVSEDVDKAQADLTDFITKEDYFTNEFDADLLNEKITVNYSQKTSRELEDLKKRLQKEQAVITDQNAQTKPNKETIKSAKRQSENYKQKIEDIEDTLKADQYKADNVNPSLFKQESIQNISKLYKYRESLKERTSKLSKEYEEGISDKGQAAYKKAIDARREEFEEANRKRKSEQERVRNAAEANDTKNKNPEPPKKPEPKKPKTGQDKVFDDIAKKIVSKEELTTEERAIFLNNTSKINRIIRDEYDSPDSTLSDRDKIKDLIEDRDAELDSLQKGNELDQSAWQEVNARYDALIAEIETGKKPPTDTEEDIEEESILNKNISELTKEEFDAQYPLDEATSRDVFSIFKEIQSNDARETLIFGFLQNTYEEEDAKNVNVKQVLKLLEDIDKLDGDGLKYSLKGVLKSMDFKDKYVDFLDEEANKNIVDRINQESYNPSAEEIDSESKRTGKQKYDDFVKALDNEETQSKFEQLFSSLLSRNNLTVDSPFQDIIDTVISSVGEEATRKMFYKLQGYVSYKTGKFYAKFSSYVDSEKSARLRKEREEKINKANRAEDMPLYTLEEIIKENNNAVRASLFMKGEVINNPSYDQDLEISKKTVITSAKTKTAHNKIAWSAFNTERVLNNGIVDKERVGDLKVEEIDRRLLIKDGIKKGDEITYRIVKSLTDRNGVTFITSKDKEGVYRTKSIDTRNKTTNLVSLESAPIQIVINGEPLKGGYLHRPGYINDEMVSNSKDNLELQLLALEALRKDILNDNNPTNKVEEVSNGHLMTSDVKASTSVNMPNVKIGVAERGKFNIGKGKSVTKFNSNIKVLNGLAYGLVEEEDGTTFPIGLHNKKLSAQQIDTVKKLISLRFKKSLTGEEDAYRDELKTKYGFDIRKVSKDDYIKFNEFLSTLIYTKSYKEMDIANELLNFKDEDAVFFMANIEGNIGFQFGTGKGNGFVLSLTGREGVEDDVLKSGLEYLDFVLRKANVNTNSNMLGKSYSFPIMKEGKITYKEYADYSEHVRENTETQFQSVRFEGVDIYRAQKSVFFNNGLTVDKKNETEKEEISNEEEESNEEVETDVREEKRDNEEIAERIGVDKDDLDNVDDLDLSLEDEAEDRYGSGNLNPDVAINEGSKRDAIAHSIMTNLNDDYYIKGLPVTVQEKMIDSIISSILTTADQNKLLGINKDNSKSKNIDLLKGTNKEELIAEIIKTIDIQKGLAAKNLRTFNKLAKGVELTQAEEESEAYIQYKKDYKKDPKKGIRVFRVLYVKRKMTLDGITDNTEKLFDFAVHKLQAYNILSKSSENINFENDSDGNVRNNFDSDYYFSIDGKQTLTSSIKNILIGIKNARIEGYKEESDGELTPIIVDKYYNGLNEIVPFDQLYDEVIGILAISKASYDDVYSRGGDLFESYLEGLEQHYESKPYLKNLVDKLKSLSKKDQNGFVTGMNKSAVNHVTTMMVKSKFFNNMSGKDETRITLNNKPSNASESSDKIVKKWAADFLNSSIIKSISGEGDVLIDRVSLDIYKNKAEALLREVQRIKEANYNEAKIEAKGYPIKQYRETIAKARIPSPSTINYISNELSDLGFKVNEATVEKLYLTGYFSSSGVVRFDDILKEHGFIGAIITRLEDIVKTNDGRFNKTVSPILSDGYFKDFAKFVTRFERQQYASSYSNGEGKNTYGYGLNKFFTDRVRDLKTNNKLLNELSDDVFSGTSILLDFLKEKGDVASYFDYETYDTNILLGGRFKANSLNSLSNAGIEQVQLSLFMNKGNSPKDSIKDVRIDNRLEQVRVRFGKLFAPHFSDKKTTMVLQTPIYTVDFKGKDTIDETNTIYDLVLEEAVMPEYYRILQSQRNRQIEVNKDSYEVGSKRFHFIPSLNSNTNIWSEETGDLIDIKDSEDIRAILREEVRGHIDNLKAEKIEEWEDADIKRPHEKSLRYSDKDFKEVEDNNADRLAYEYVSNYLINNANFFKLFAGDPANYTKGDIKSTFDNVSKRLAAMIAPGTDIIPTDGSKEIRWGVMEEMVKSNTSASKSVNIKHYTKLLGKDTADLYSKMEGDDAMGYTSLKEYLNIEHARGNISLKEANRITKIDNSLDKDGNKGVLSDPDLTTISNLLKANLFNSLKPVYFNNFKDGDNGFRPFYVKQSALPLVNTLVKGTELEKLKKVMDSEGIDHLVYPTAVKTGAPIKKVNIFNKDGTIRDDITFKKEDANGNSIDGDSIVVSPRQGHKIQQDNKLGKTESTDGTQQRKLLFTDLLDTEGFSMPNVTKPMKGSKLKQDYDKLYTSLIKKKYDAFAERIKYNKDTGSVDLEALQTVLKEEFLSRNYPLSDLESIGIIKDGNDQYIFKQPLWTSTISSKIESILVSMVDHDIRQHKITGKSYILSSSVGFKPTNIITGNTAEEFIENNKTQILFDKDWVTRKDNPGILRGQTTIKNKDGVDEVQPAEIMIPMYYQKEVNGKMVTINLKDIAKDGFIDTDKIPADLLKSFGYRIPTQGHNSMSYMKVVGFLPPTHSEMIIAPSEFVVQMGSDFDIDKLYTNFYSARFEKGKLVKNNSNDESIAGIENSLMDIKLSVLSNANPEVQKKILTPLDKNLFEGFGKEIEKAYEEEKEYSPISQSEFKRRYISGVTGNEAIGVFANASTLHALLQRSDDSDETFHLLEGIIEKKNLSFKLGKYNANSAKRNNNLSSSKVGGNLADGSNGKATKSGLISDLITLAVDNENLQALGKLNINKHTYNMTVGLAMSGFNEEFISYFLNQPIIRDYVEKSYKVQDKSIESYNSEARINEIAEKYSIPTNKTIDDNGRETTNLDYRNGEDKAPQHIYDFTNQDLLTNIKDRKKNTGEEGYTDYKQQQAFILTRFITLTKKFNEINKLQEALNVDGSKGLGNSIIYLNAKADQIRNLGDIDITNPYTLIGDLQEATTPELGVDLASKGTVLSKGAGRPDLYLIPKNVTGAIVAYGVLEGSRMYTSDETLFPYKNNALKTKIERIGSILDGSDFFSTVDTQSDNRRKALNIVKQHLYSDFYGDLLDDTIREERIKILSDKDDNESLATILNNIAITKPTIVLNSYLLNRLQGISGNKSEVSSLKFDASNELASMQFITSALLELFENNNIIYRKKDGSEYTSRDLALDLVKHQFITGGVQLRDQFIKYIPFKVLDSIGFTDNVNNINFDALNDEVLNDNLIIQLYQNFPDNLTKVYDSNTYNPKTEILTMGEDFGIVIKNLVDGVEHLFKYDSYDDNGFYYKRIDFAGDPSNGFNEFDFNSSDVKSIIPYNNLIKRERDFSLSFNKTEVQRALNNDVVFLYKQDDNDNNPKSFKQVTFAEYNDYLRRYREVGDESQIIVIYKKNAEGVPQIFDTRRFKGMLEIAQNSNIIFSSNLEKGVDYDILGNEEFTQKELEENEAIEAKRRNNQDTVTKEFERRFSITGDSKQDLTNIIETLKVNNSDAEYNYVYDSLLGNIDTLFENNPDLVFKLLNEDTKVGGFVAHDNNEVFSINLDPKLINTLERSFNTADKKNIHNVVIEEFLHAMTVTANKTNPRVKKELNDLRLEYIESLNPTQKEAYERTVEKNNSYKVALNIIPRDGLNTLKGYKKALDNNKIYKDTLAYKAIKEKVDNFEGEYLDLSELKDKLLKTNKLTPEEYSYYYPLVDTEEFIAGAFVIKSFQSLLNEKKSTGKKTIFQRFIAALVRFLGGSSTKRGKTSKRWERLFRQGVNKESMLEDVISKSISLIKVDSNFTKEEKSLIKEEFKSVDMRPKDINEYFNLSYNNVFYPQDNAKEKFNGLREIFPNAEFILRDDYIIAKVPGEEIDLNNLDYAVKKEEEDIDIKNDQTNKELNNEIKELVNLLPKIDKESTSAKKGSVVKYTPKGKKERTFIIRSIKDGKARLIDSDGSFFSGTPSVDKLNIIGSYPLVTYNKNEFVVSSKGNIYSLKATKKVQGKSSSLSYIGESNSVLNQRKSIYNKVLGNDYDNQLEINLSPAAEELSFEENRKKRIEVLYRNRVSKLKDSMNIAKGEGNNDKFVFLNKVLEDLQEQREDIEKIEGLEDIFDRAIYDLEEVETILSKDDLTNSDIVYVEKVISNWKSVYKNYFTEEEIKFVKPLVEKFSAVVSKAEELQKTMISKLIKITERDIKENTGEVVDIIDYFKNGVTNENGKKVQEAFKDINLAQKQVLDIGRIDNPVLHHVYDTAQKAFGKTKIESHDKLAEAETLINNAIPSLKKYSNKENGMFNIFFQKYSDGSLSGDMIGVFNRDFIDLKRSKFRSLKIDDKSQKKKNAASLNDWLNKNTINFDAYTLFRGDDNDAKEAHIAELKGILGDKVFEYFYDQQEEMVIKYEEEKAEMLSKVLLTNDVKTKEDLKMNPKGFNEYQTWKAKNSPYVYYNQVKNNKLSSVTLLNEESTGTYQSYIFNTGFERIIDIPKKVDSKGNDLNYYDKSFNTIINDKDLFAFYKGYNKIFQELKHYLPKDAQELIKYNGLPELQKTFYENLRQGGVAKSFSGAYSNTLESIRVSDLSTVSNEDVDENTGRISKTLKFGLFNNNSLERERYIQERTWEYETSESNPKGYSPDADMLDEYHKDFNNKVGERKSKDLGKLLKAYVGLALTYKHKSRVQDTILVTDFLFDTLDSPRRNPNGDILTNFGTTQFNPQATALNNMKDSFQHFKDNFFDSPYDLEWVTTKKVLTPEEKKSRTKLIDIRDTFDVQLEELEVRYEENQIKTSDYEARKGYLTGHIEDIDKSLKELGGNFVGSKLGDNILKYFQLKGMGWNILAGFGNLGFGIIGNIIESSDGRVINAKEMRDAMALTLHSVKRNATFNQTENDGIGGKIRSIMDRNDILKDASHELYSNSIKSTFMKRLRFLSPYNMQKRTEYINQAPIMIALYKKTMVTLEDGTKMSLWDGYGNDGQWNVSKFGKEPIINILKANSKITQLIKRVHGNYDPSSPLRIKKTMGGRAISQFRTWLFEGVAARWEGYNYDRDLEVGYKGRYRSVPTYFKEYGAIGGTVDILKAMVLKLVGRKETFENGKLSELDAANMRKLVTELTAYLTMMAIYLTLNAAFRDDDDDDYKQHALNLQLNMINRLKGEITMYINPLEAATMIKNPAPAMSVIDDTGMFIGRMFNLFNPFSDKPDAIENGIYRGQSRALKSTKSLFPVGSILKSFESNSSQVFD